MKIILLSDAHLTESRPIGRTDNFQNAQVKKVEFIFNYAEKRKAKILQAGDLFDKPRGYNVLYLFSRLLKRYPGVQMYSVAGQHDMYLRSTSVSNLRLLWSLARITRLRKTKLSRNITVHGVDYNGSIPTPKSSGYHILVIHAPITVSGGEDFLSHIKYSTAKSFLKKHSKYDLILCGDIHKKFLLEYEGRRILNSGPLLRTSTSEHIMQHKPGFYVLDTDKDAVKWVSIPHKKSSDVMTVAHKKDKVVEAQVLDFINEVNDAKITEIDLTKKLRIMLDGGIISGNVANILSDLMEE